MADSKKIRFVVRGEIQLDEECSLEDATLQVKEIAERARAFGGDTVDVQMSVPRLTNVKM